MEKLVYITEENANEVWTRIDKHEAKGLHSLECECSICGIEAVYFMNEEESRTLEKYWCYGRQMGLIQNVFPNVPAWIRSGAIDKYSNGFCICPSCCGNEM